MVLNNGHIKKLSILWTKSKIDKVENGNWFIYDDTQLFL